MNPASENLTKLGVVGQNTFMVFTLLLLGAFATILVLIVDIFFSIDYVDEDLSKGNTEINHAISKEETKIHHVAKKNTTETDISIEPDRCFEFESNNNKPGEVKQSENGKYLYLSVEDMHPSSIRNAYAKFKDSEEYSNYPKMTLCGRIGLSTKLLNKINDSELFSSYFIAPASGIFFISIGFLFHIFSFFSVTLAVSLLDIINAKNKIIINAILHYSGWIYCLGWIVSFIALYFFESWLIVLCSAVTMLLAYTIKKHCDTQNDIIFNHVLNGGHKKYYNVIKEPSHQQRFMFMMATSIKSSTSSAVSTTFIQLMYGRSLGIILCVMPLYIDYVSLGKSDWFYFSYKYSMSALLIFIITCCLYALGTNFFRDVTSDAVFIDSDRRTSPSADEHHSS